MLETTLVIARDHPACEGHFPGHPVLPAVVLLAEAFAALGVSERRHSLTQAKFLRSVAPGTALTLAHETHAHGLRLEIRAAGEVVATATLESRAT